MAAATEELQAQLVRAAENDDLETLAALLDLGVPVDGVAWYTRGSEPMARTTALCAAARCLQLRAVELLLKRGAFAGVPRNCMPLFSLAWGGPPASVLAILSCLLAAGASVATPAGGPRSGLTVLHYALMQRAGREAVAALLAAGAPVDGLPYLRQRMPLTPLGMWLRLSRPVGTPCAATLGLLVAAGADTKLAMAGWAEYAGDIYAAVLDKWADHNTSAALLPLLTTGAPPPPALWRNAAVTRLPAREKATLLAEAAWARRKHLVQARCRLKQAYDAEAETGAAAEAQATTAADTVAAADAVAADAVYA
jgi:hypothetical protein